MEPLLHERNTAFTHSLWSRYEYLQHLVRSPALHREHELGYLELGYSAVQDAFYALKDELPNNSPAGQAWSQVINSEAFPRLQSYLTSPDSTINTTLYLAKKFREHFLRQKEDTTPTPGTNQKEVSKRAQAENKAKEKIAQRYDNRELRADKQDTTPQHLQSTNEIEQAIEELLQQAEERNEQPDDGDQPGEDGQEGQEQPGEGQDGEGQEQPGDVSPSDSAGPQFGQEIVIPKRGSISFDESELGELEEQNETFEIMAGLQAGTGPGPREIREFTEQMFDGRQLTRVAELVGFATRVMGGAKRKNVGATGEFVGYGFDTLTANTHPRDRSDLARGSLLSLSRFADRKLTTRRFDEHKPAGKGAAVLLSDESGSMAGRFHQTDSRRNQSTNFQLAMAQVFKNESRPFTSIAWDSHSTRLYEYGQPGLQDHLNEFLGGGTRVGHAIHKALDWIDSKPQYKKKADILIISDGSLSDDPAEDNALMERIASYKKDGGRIWFVFVQMGDSVVESYAKYIKRWADFVMSLDSFYDETKLAKVFELMGTDHEQYASYQV